MKNRIKKKLVPLFMIVVLMVSVLGVSKESNAAVEIYGYFKSEGKWYSRRVNTYNSYGNISFRLSYWEYNSPYNIDEDETQLLRNARGIALSVGNDKYVYETTGLRITFKLYERGGKKRLKIKQSGMVQDWGGRGLNFAGKYVNISALG